MAAFRAMSTGWTIVFGILVGILATNWFFRRRIPKGLRLPPGPAGKLFFGNASDMPVHQEWETYSQWANSYGDLVHVRVLNTHMVFVNSAEVAHDLFEKRSSIYSDRAHSPMLNDLMGFSWDFGLMPYGDMWRRHRKMFNQKFRQVATVAYREVQTKQTRNLLKRLCESPDDFMMHIRHLSGATIMEISYGIKVLPKNDPYIQIAELAAVLMVRGSVPGVFLVDAFPILKYVPAWMPGAGFQRKARAWRVPITEMIVAPFEFVKKSLAEGNAAPSILASLLENLATRSDAPPDEEEVIRNILGIAYLGGAETTVSSLNSFILAMALHPEVQRKAQAELDSVIGMDRLPVFKDRDELPYINAMCKEVFRWHPVAPMGVAHRVTCDDIYGDLFIPRGSVIVGNAWAILHDERTFGPEPEKFIPERFLKPEIMDPTFAFGFGRRICPGRYMADNSVFIAVASILKVFDITHARDNHGKEIPIKGTYTSGFLSHPEPFQCSIKPRSDLAESLIFEASN